MIPHPPQNYEKGVGWCCFARKIKQKAQNPKLMKSLLADAGITVVIAWGSKRIYNILSGLEPTCKEAKLEPIPCSLASDHAPPSGTFILWYFTMALYSSTLLWYFTLSLYSDTLLWHFTLVLFFCTLLWHFTPILYFDTLVWLWYFTSTHFPNSNVHLT